MCQYSVIDGHMTPWHVTHYGGIAQQSLGLMIIKETGVLLQGRITSGCLAHAGRKASNIPPWLGGVTATNAVGGWVKNVMVPRASPFAQGDIVPKAMASEDVQVFMNAWMAAVYRALAAGVDSI
ncbi:hypothetical protein PENANT_c001G01625 [Penicillium antarcticum]|uniref:Uncharacterized protein n=1 Tax=Penicillium antarcticum TaxID=416450 RepID=A0A1V6QPL6_9EURO|nr:uncharacterized protein N7508_010810 [Penicillium antarcticum]KAJ5295989.1 hypothetical protein N7508_010810 [Penicillium antarcticum]OQD90886.1 hypothetical protein PENANT_c001G01625 [Penicillium antarcticum]